MEPYLWKTRPDGINLINIGKTWLVPSSSYASGLKQSLRSFFFFRDSGRRLSSPHG